MIGLLLVVAVLNLGLGYGLAVVLGHGTLPMGLSMPKLSLRGKKSAAEH